jgi:hypothetical protein
MTKAAGYREMPAAFVFPVKLISGAVYVEATDEFLIDSACCLHPITV